jgi:3-oxoacyl-[acyl-carrier protein] reductase
LQLEGKKAVITGGTRGIGLAICNEFARNGADLLIIGVNIERGERVVSELERDFPGGNFYFQAVDVSSYTAVNAFADEWNDYLKDAHFLVNSAGITRDNFLIRLKECDWDDVIDTNLKSVFNMTSVMLRAMIKNRRGVIINISSVVGGHFGNPGQVNYAASKAGMIGMTKSLAKEVAGKNVRVNCIAPGFIQTDMTAGLNEKNKEKLLEKIPLKKFGSSESIAKAALFLASDASDYITGHTLTVDGGMTC